MDDFVLFFIFFCRIIMNDKNGNEYIEKKCFEKHVFQKFMTSRILLQTEAETDVCSSISSVWYRIIIFSIVFIIIKILHFQIANVNMKLTKTDR